MRHHRDDRPSIYSWSGRSQVASKLDEAARMIVARALSEQIRAADLARRGAGVWRDEKLAALGNYEVNGLSLDIVEIEKRIRSYADQIDMLRELGDRLGLTVADFMKGDSKDGQVDKSDAVEQETPETAEE